MAVKDSPFPGMDPYLQRRWSDVHNKLIAFLGEALTPGLPAGLRARTEERVLLEDEDSDSIGQWYRPDVVVVTARPRVGGDRSAASATSVPDWGAAAVVVELPVEPEVDRWVQIIDTSEDNRVVTAIAVLSPANKRRGPLNDLYRRKLKDYARGQVNVVEVDLVRGTRARLSVGRADLPPSRRTPFLIGVRRAPVAERWVCYPVSLRRPIPPIPIPLRPSDADAVMDLQPLLQRAYRAGGHDDIDYTRDPDPPLSPADAAWADALLRTAGRR